MTRPCPDSYSSFILVHRYRGEGAALPLGDPGRHDGGGRKVQVQADGGGQRTGGGADGVGLDNLGDDGSAHCTELLSEYLTLTKVG